MPRTRRARGRKRSSIELDDENLNVVNQSPPRATKSQRKRHVVNADQFQSILDELNLEVESRVDQLRKSADNMAFSMKSSMRTQLNKLPNKIRKMSMAVFVQQYSSDVASVISEDIQRAQQDLDTWVAATPRLTAHKSKSKKVLATPATSRRPRRAAALTASKRIRRTARKTKQPIGGAVRVTRSMRKRSQRAASVSESETTDAGNDAEDVSSDAEEPGQEPELRSIMSKLSQATKSCTDNSKLQAIQGKLDALLAELDED